MSDGKPAKDIDEAVREYGDSLFRYCLVILGNVQDAQDAVQETFIRYIRKRPLFDNSEHEKAWLLKVAANRCKDMIRFRISHQTVNIEEISIMAKEKENTGIIDALMSLPEKLRSVLLLYYVEGYKTEEIAEMINRSPSAVKMRLMKGRALLKEAYEREGNEWKQTR